MAGLVASVTNDNQSRGTGYPNDERGIQDYDFDSIYACKTPVSTRIINSICVPVNKQ